MNTKEVCQRLNITPKALRVYEKYGLINASRDENDYRNYSLEDISRLDIIVRLRGLDFSIKEIQHALDNENTINDFGDLFYLQLKAVDNKIKELTNARNQLITTINEIMQQPDVEGVMETIHRNITPKQEQQVYASAIKEWDFDIMASDYVNEFLWKNKDYECGVAAARQKIINMNEDGILGTVIDIGCGTANIWEQANPGDYNLTGIDNCLNMVMVAKKKVPWATFRFEDILTMETDSHDKYDTVFSTFTMHHIERSKHEKFLKQMASLCSRGGRIIIVDKCFANGDEQNAFKKKLIEKGEIQEAENLNAEWPMYMEDTCSYMDHLGWGVRETAVSDLLSELLLESVSFNDYNESFYHATLLGLMVDARHIVKSNRENGLGRSDLTVERRAASSVLIVEVKVAASEDRLDAKADEALRQIEDKRYAASFKGHKNVLLWGVAFCRKSCIAKAAWERKV